MNKNVTIDYNPRTETFRAEDIENDNKMMSYVICGLWKYVTKKSLKSFQGKGSVCFRWGVSVCDKGGWSSEGS